MDPPAPDEGDLAYLIGKTLVAGIPIIGSAASEVFGALVRSPAQRRLEGFLEDVVRRLDELEHEGHVKASTLPSKDAFVDTAFHAVRSAIQNSQPEKQRAYRNAILNAALPRYNDPALQQMYLDILDGLTDWHLKILRFIAGPHTFDGPRTSVGEEIAKKFPMLRRREKVVEKVWRDLDQAGLVNYEKSIAATVDLFVALEASVSTFGTAFLLFINDPGHGGFDTPGQEVAN